MSQFWAAILLIIGCSLSTASYAKGGRSDGECSAKNARQITVAEASRRIKSLEQTCVQIAGITDGWTLYGDFGDIYRNTDAWKEHNYRQWSEGRIGLRPFPNADEEDEKRPTSGTWSWSRIAPRRVTLIGRLHDCGLDWSTGDPNGPDYEIRMGTGWCHYNAGAVLRPVAIAAESPVKFTRVTGKRARQRFGDIVPFRKNDALAANIHTVLKQLLEATRRGDRRAVLDFYGLTEVALASNGIDIAEDELAEYDEESDPAFTAKYTLDLLFGNPDSALAKAIRDDALAVRLFEPRWKMDYQPDAWACWAAKSATETDWPISSIDAFNVAGRPYACIGVVEDSSRPEGVSIVDTVPYRPWARREAEGKASR